MPQLKQLARQIFHETLAAIDIPATMQRKLRRKGTMLVCGEKRIDLRDFEKLRVVAIGKAAEAILALLKKCDEKTLVFFLLSGGGSALVELPLDPAQTLEDVQNVHRALVTCGAPIEAINTIRKHISAVKGGRLAAAANSATKITLAVSDVPVGKESALASGPTLPDPTTVADAKRITGEHRLYDRFPLALRRWLAEGKMPETPKASAPAFRNSHFSLLLGLDDLFHPAHHAA